MRNSYVGCCVFAVVMMLMVGVPAVSGAQVAVGITVGFAPPDLPVYEQPICPEEGYIWTPGYWAYDPDFGDYFGKPYADRARGTRLVCGEKAGTQGELPDDEDAATFRDTDHDAGHDLRRREGASPAHDHPLRGTLRWLSVLSTRALLPRALLPRRDCRLLEERPLVSSPLRALWAFDSIPAHKLPRLSRPSRLPRPSPLTPGELSTPDPLLRGSERGARRFVRSGGGGGEHFADRNAKVGKQRGRSRHPGAELAVHPVRLAA